MYSCGDIAEGVMLAGAAQRSVSMTVKVAEISSNLRGY